MHYYFQSIIFALSFSIDNIGVVIAITIVIVIASTMKVFLNSYKKGFKNVNQMLSCIKKKNIQKHIVGDVINITLSKIVVFDKYSLNLSLIMSIMKIKTYILSIMNDTKKIKTYILSTINNTKNQGVNYSGIE